jgi:hypothetical protein
MKKYFYILFCGIFISACGEKKLTAYQCKGHFHIEECPTDCEKSDDRQYAFMINVEQHSVLQKFYSEGKIIGSILHENCKFFDERNWDCSRDDELSGAIYKFHSTKMVDGIFSEYSTYTNINTNKVSSETETTYCAR